MKILHLCFFVVRFVEKLVFPHPSEELIVLEIQVNSLDFLSPTPCVICFKVCDFSTFFLLQQKGFSLFMSYIPLYWVSVHVYYNYKKFDKWGHNFSWDQKHLQP